MSKTDKTRPMWVRLEESGAELAYIHKGKKCYFWPSDFECSNRDRGFGPGYIKWAKRHKSKKNRRREEPLTQMRGHGYGFENYRWD